LSGGISSSRAQRLGSQPTLFHSSGQFLKPTAAAMVGGTPFAADEKMPSDYVSSRQQRRSQPSILVDMQAHLIAKTEPTFRHSQPMLYCPGGPNEFALHALRTPPPLFIQRAHGSGSSSKTSSPGTGRKLPRPPPPERRILRRSPQSDLFPRFQQHRHQLESGSVNQLHTALPNEALPIRNENGECLGGIKLIKNWLTFAPHSLKSIVVWR
jgi:hypothetical protein